MPAIFSTMMRFKQKFPKQLLSGWSHSAARIQQKGSKLNLLCGYIYTLAHISSLCCFVQFVFPLRAAKYRGRISSVSQLVPFWRKKLRKHSRKGDKHQPGSTHLHRDMRKMLSCTQQAKGSVRASPRPNEENKNAVQKHQTSIISERTVEEEGNSMKD